MKLPAMFLYLTASLNIMITDEFLFRFLLFSLYFPLLSLVLCIRIHSKRNNLWNNVSSYDVLEIYNEEPEPISEGS